MKIILLENIKTLGNKGELKEVAEGYARNFLLPKNLAEIATPDSIDRLKQNQKQIQEKEKGEEEKMKKIASEIQGKKITIRAKAEKNKLFGSIGTKEISEELKKINFDISEKSIILKEPIKNLGEKEISIQLGKNEKIKITVAVEKA